MNATYNGTSQFLVILSRASSPRIALDLRSPGCTILAKGIRTSTLLGFISSISLVVATVEKLLRRPSRTASRLCNPGLAACSSPFTSVIADGVKKLLLRSGVISRRSETAIPCNVLSLFSLSSLCRSYLRFSALKSSSNKPKEICTSSSLASLSESLLAMRPDSLSASYAESISNFKLAACSGTPAFLPLQDLHLLEIFFQHLLTHLNSGRALAGRVKVWRAIIVY